MAEEITVPESGASIKSNAIPKGVWALGFVSLLMDTSSEMIHSLLPVFLVSVLGVSAFSVGVIEGIAEATAAVTKVFSGILSDWAGKRKPLVLVGYGLAALTKRCSPWPRRWAGWSPPALPTAWARESGGRHGTR